MTVKDMQQRVLDEAMERHIVTLEKEATAERQDQVHFTRVVQGNIDEEKGEQVRRREICKRNQLLLQEQIEENKYRRAQQRRDVVDAASAHQFPIFTETFISQDEVDAYHQQKKEQFRKDLNEQMVTSTMLRNLEKKQFHEHAKAQQVGVADNMVKQRGKEQERLRNMGKELVSAWDRDLRLKNLRKCLVEGKPAPNPR